VLKQEATCLSPAVEVHSFVVSFLCEIAIDAVLVLFLRFRPRRLLPVLRFQLQRSLL
jgi:hypothetical protein